MDPEKQTIIIFFYKSLDNMIPLVFKHTAGQSRFKFTQNRLG